MARPFATKPVGEATRGLPFICEICSEKATVEASFDIGNCTVIRKYCDNCLSEQN
jgi:hypothetical protein